MSVEYWRDGRFLLVRFITEEDSDWIVWPSQAAAKRTDELWKTTCFEVFVASDDGYLEYNLSPSSEWATYRFNRYREGMQVAEEQVVSGGVRFDAYTAILQAQIELPSGADRLGFSAVIETTDGMLRYWALVHPSDRPDFHHPDSFILTLPPPEPA
jgi:hypothetical protein